MPVVPLGKGAYRRTASRGPEIRLVNRYFEAQPTNLVDGGMLLTRPSLTRWQNLGANPIRGVWRKAGVYNGDLIAVMGTGVYRIAASGTTELLTGSVPGTGPVVIDGLENEVFIANGTGLYRASGGAVSLVSFPDAAGVSSVACIRGFVIAVRADTQRLYWRLPGFTTWDALDVVSAEQSADKVIHVVRLRDEILAFGEETVEPFYLTGDPDVAIATAEGRSYETGALARDSIAKIDNTVYWVGAGENGAGVVYRLDGAGPVRISDHGLEERIAGVTASSIRAWAFMRHGHAFYVLHLGAAGTFVFDAATGQWSQWVSDGSARWRAACGTFMTGVGVVAGDETTGQIWVLSDNGVDDAPVSGTVPMARAATGGLPVTGGRVACSSFRLTCAVGQGGSATIGLRFSDDYGQTFFDAGTVSLGATGETDREIYWNRLGSMRAPGRVFEVYDSGSVATRISYALVNEAL